MTSPEMPVIEAPASSTAALAEQATPTSETSEPLTRLRRRLLLVAVFAVSLSVLAFEIALTRLFAAVLAYHFVFAAVSAGLLGLALGGILLAWLPREEDEAAALRRLGTFALGEALTIVSALLFFLRYPAADRLLPFALAAFPPFLLAGLFLSLALRRFAAEGSRVYFSDLAGAATGSLVVVLLLQALQPPATILLLAGVAALGAALCAAAGRGRPMAAVAGLLGLAAAGLALGDREASWLQLDLAAKRGTSKHLLSLLGASDRRVRPLGTTWDAYARTDVVEVGDGEAAKRIIFTDGGGAAVMPRFRGTVADAQRVLADVGLLPYLWGRNDRVLILGAGGGLDVLQALLGGAGEVTAVEVNPATVRAVLRFADYNGDLYRFRNVKVVVAEGRNYVRRSKEQYDVIYLPLVVTQAAERAGYSLVENYLFTVEAFRDYLAHLRPGGRLVLKTHDLTDLTRAFATALVALDRDGTQTRDPARQILVFQGRAANPREPGGVMYPLPMLRNTPYAPGEVEEIFRVGVGAGLFPFFVPGIHDALGFGRLASERQALLEFLSAFPARIAPTTDESPFFYEYSRWLAPHLLWLLGGVAFLTLVVLGIAGKAGGQPARKHAGWTPVAYFAALGGAFMLVEIPVLQRSILTLGYPILAFSVVLFALLTGAGVGSHLSAWVAGQRLARGMSWVSLLAGLLVIAWLWGGLPLLERWVGAGLLPRSVLTMGLLLPLGFFMGMPFPLGIRLLERDGQEAAVPWMWAVNGVASVLGSVAAVAIAIVAGFSWAMLLGAFLYAVAACLARLGLGSLHSSAGLGMPA